MADRKSDWIQFNRRMDKLVENVISRDLVIPEFRAEYFKAGGFVPESCRIRP